MTSDVERLTGLRDMEYLGDGVYAGVDGYQIWVVAFDGISVNARVALPADGTFQNLLRKGTRHYGLPPASEDEA